CVVVIAAMGLGPIGGAACAASPDQELVLLEALPKRRVVLIDVGQRLVPRLLADDHFCAAHGCRPSNVQVGIEHMPGDSSSPPCPVVNPPLRSLTCRSPASPRS